MYCYKCGEQAANDDAFCGKCGASLMLESEADGVSTGNGASESADLSDKERKLIKQTKSWEFQSSLVWLAVGVLTMAGTRLLLLSLFFIGVGVFKLYSFNQWKKGSLDVVDFFRKRVYLQIAASIASAWYIKMVLTHEYLVYVASFAMCAVIMDWYNRSAVLNNKALFSSENERKVN